MTAALLRNELFHHLLATNPEKRGSENVRAGAVALAFHGVIALLLMQIPTASHPVKNETVTGPIVLENISLRDYAPPQTSQGGTQRGIGGMPSLIPPVALPDFGLPTVPSFRIGREPAAINMDPPALTRGGVNSERGVGSSPGGGTFTVLQNAPRMLNASHIMEVLRREYPPNLMRAGIGGTVLMHVLIDFDGRVVDARVARSSGIGALDDAALRVSREMLFSPAQNREHVVRVWAEIPIVFSSRD